MKIAFIIHNEYQTSRVMELLHAAGIDYYTRWDQATGKGRGTEPHLGSGSYGSTNSVLMIAFEEEAPLEALIQAIVAANRDIRRPDERIHLFQVPLERMV
jgi:nitrogen regulatory protein PII